MSLCRSDDLGLSLLILTGFTCKSMVWMDGGRWPGRVSWCRLCLWRHDWSNSVWSRTASHHEGQLRHIYCHGDGQGQGLPEMCAFLKHQLVSFLLSFP